MVRRIELDGVVYQPAAVNGCGATITVVRHFDPPVTVNGSGSFTATLIPVDSGVMAVDLVSVSGQVFENLVYGTTSFSASNGQPEQGCSSDPLTLTPAGKIHTPPDSNETLYAGTVAGYAGLLEFHQEFGGGITSIGLDAVTGPCGAISSPIDARDFFAPPVAQAPGTGAFTTALQFSSTNFPDLRRVTVAGTQPDANTLTGSITVQTFVPSCTDSATWTATRIASVGGLTELASAAAEAPGTSARSTAAIALAGLLAIVVVVPVANALSRRRS